MEGRYAGGISDEDDGRYYWGAYLSPQEEAMQKQAKVSKTDEGREKKKGSDTESDSSSSESDSDDDSSSSSSSFSEDEDDAETCDKNFLESGLLRLPEELAFFGSKSHWCKRLAPLIDKLRNSALPLDERGQSMRKLAMLEAEFISTATLYGKIIIAERFLPHKKKRILPIDIGGKAGGIKYSMEGILFKFAWDSEGIYDGDLKAMKAACHELNSVKDVFMHLPAGLYVPMMVALDFKGFKLLAVSLLPIGKHTLVYGSQDSGQTVFADPEVVGIAAELGRSLNLKAHTSGEQKQQKIYLPADIEIHKGEDGKFYMLDFSRLWPPEIPKPSVRASFLIRKLRPELVRSYSKPLCSDAFSRFQTGSAEEKAENSQDVADAFLHMLKELIPTLVAKLQKEISDPESIAKFNVTEALHEQGINMRHLGVLWCHFDNKDWKNRVLTEAVFRVAKNTIQTLMRRAMKTLQFVNDEPYIRLIVDYVNLLFGDTEESAAYWKTELRWNLEKNFFYVGDCTKHLKRIVKKDFKEHVSLVSILERLPGKLGFQVNEEFMQKIRTQGFFRRAVVVKEQDLLGLEPVVTSGLTEQPRAFALYEQAFFTDDKHFATRDDLLKKTTQTLARTAKPLSSNHFLTFRLWSKAVIALSDEEFLKAFPAYVAYAKWLFGLKILQPTEGLSEETWRSFVLEFVKDYLWMVLGLYERCYSSLASIELRDPRYDENTIQLYQDFLDPALLVLSALPSAQAVIGEGLSALLEPERPTNVYENLNFVGFDFLSERKWADVFDYIGRQLKRNGGGMRELRIVECTRLDTSILGPLLGPMLTTLEIVGPSWLPLFPSICSQCRNLRRLVLSSRRDYSIPDDWVQQLMATMHDSLRELSLSGHLAYVEGVGSLGADCLLANLELLSCESATDLFAKEFQMPNLRSLSISESRGYSFKGCPALRSFTVRGYIRDTDMLEVCQRLAESCPLSEEIQFPDGWLAIEQLEALSSSEAICKNLRKISVNQFRPLEGGNEDDLCLAHETLVLRLLSTKFSSITHLSVTTGLSKVPENQGELLQSLLSSPGSDNPKLPLEYLLVSPGRGVTGWLSFLHQFKDTLKEVALPGDVTDEHVSELGDLLTGIEAVDLSATLLTISGLKRLLSSLRSLTLVRLPSALCRGEKLAAALIAIMPILGTQVRTVFANIDCLVNEGLGHPQSAWPRLLELRKGAVLPVQVVIEGIDNSRAKLTGALGREDDIIDGFDALIVRRLYPGSDQSAAKLRLNFIQSLHWEGNTMA